MNLAVFICGKVCIFHKVLRWSSYFREWEVFENFEFINFCKSTESEKKNVSVKKTNVSLFKKRKAGHDGKTVVID